MHNWLMRYKLWWLLLITVLLLSDQYSKQWALTQLNYGQPQAVFLGLNFSLSFNHGVAFGWFNQNSDWLQWGLLLLIAVIIGGLLYGLLLKTKPGQTLQSFALSLMIGGAIGNFVDRINQGYVIDFIDFYVNGWHWHTFNLADSYICLGTALMLYWLWFGHLSSVTKE